MSLHAIAVGVGYLGAGLGVAMVIPQIARTLRDRTLPGVSALSWGLTALACTAWLLYGIRAAEMPQIPGNILLASGAVLLALVVPSPVSLVLRVLGLVVFGAALAGIASVGPPTFIGAFAFGIAVVSGLPQTLKSLRRRDRPTSAVSVSSWFLRVVSQTCWLFFALVVHDTTVLVSAVFLLSNAILVWGVELARKSSAAPVAMAAATC